MESWYSGVRDISTHRGECGWSLGTVVLGILGECGWSLGTEVVG